MGKVKKNKFFSLSLGALWLLGSLFFMLPLTGKAVGIEVKLDIQQVPQTVTVGQKGKLDFKIQPLEGVPTSGEVNFISNNPAIFKIDRNGNWEAVKSGNTMFYDTIKLSSETKQALLAKYGHYGICDDKAIFPVTVLPAAAPVYRLYNPTSGEHFYTPVIAERDSLTKLGWRNEGTAWQTYSTGVPVYRVYNPNAGDHHYTISQVEVTSLVERGWRNEGISFYAATQQNKPIYRLYNPNAKVGSHHYTKELNEKNSLTNSGWKYEGIAWYE